MSSPPPRTPPGYPAPLSSSPMVTSHLTPLSPFHLCIAPTPPTPLPVSLLSYAGYEPSMSSILLRTEVDHRPGRALRAGGGCVRAESLTG
jgi:hypothetical protein